MTSRFPSETKIVSKDEGIDPVLIAPRERDVALDLHSTQWGAKLEPDWELHKAGRTFYRDLTVISGNEKRPLRDHILRFPSAPIYGINRKQDYELNFTRPNMHTLRLLTRPREDDAPITRLFLLQNGLNEWQNLRFFYRLADWILKEDESSKEPCRSACLLAPFPGHLMHFPYDGPFAQLPLSRYLSDAGDLFRHFLRYMMETRWLLSIVNPSPPESWLVGGEPLPQKNLSCSLLEDWNALRNASVEALRDGTKTPDAEISDEALVGQTVELKDAESAVKILRDLLSRKDDSPQLPIHVVGYSLGGFVAQCVFFAWPNMITSCATICSGGAIRALSPTAFAHSEEWQSVLHSLRAEIEGSMLAGKISRSDADGRIAGIDSAQFGYFHRVFNQVFLQEDQASYKQRLSEHGSRMLFISGGEDPIVKTRDVLDASPDEGITMLSVARLTHFLAEDARSELEDEQRQFWLPESGGLIARAATRAEELKAKELRQADELRRKAESPAKATGRKPVERDLGSPDFEAALDWVVGGVTRKTGWLFVCRNGIPAAFLPPEHRLAQGAALHHHDVAVQGYVLGLARRAKALEEIRDRTTLCLSRKLKPVFIGSGELFDPHNDAVGKLVTEEERNEVWSTFVDAWNDRVRWFEAGQVGRSPKGLKREKHFQKIVKNFARHNAHREGIGRKDLKISRLPDVWISLAKWVIEMPDTDPEATAMNFVDWVDGLVAKHQSNPKLDEEGGLSELLSKGKVRIVRVSGSELNPRYRGRWESKPEAALLLLSHCAAALLRSRQGPAPG
ncbi:MAG TPA: hypothetical protein VNN15_07610 [Solirubrobacterales bacterium]|nr:hypothetical protein [Solirubrobacterales bacterium]